MLKYPGGGTATLIYHSRADMSCSAEIYGTKGYYKVNYCLK